MMKPSSEIMRELCGRTGLVVGRRHCEILEELIESRDAAVRADERERVQDAVESLGRQNANRISGPYTDGYDKAIKDVLILPCLQPAPPAIPQCCLDAARATLTSYGYVPLKFATFDDAVERLAQEFAKHHHGATNDR